jgi:hypothetical protein
MRIVLIDIEDDIVLFMGLSEFKKDSQSFNIKRSLGFIDFFLEESVKISDGFSAERNVTSVGDIIVEFFDEIGEEGVILRDSAEDVVDLFERVGSVEIDGYPFSEVFELDEFGGEEVGFSENFEVVHADVKAVGIKLDFGVLEVVENGEEKLEFKSVHNGVELGRLSSDDFSEVSNEDFSFVDEVKVSTRAEGFIVLVLIGDFVKSEQGVEDGDFQRAQVEVNGDEVSEDIFEFTMVIIQDLGFDISVHVDGENFFKSVLFLHVIVKFVAFFDRVLETGFKHHVFNDDILFNSEFLGFEISFLGIMGLIDDEVKFHQSFVFLGIVFKLLQRGNTILDSSLIFCG